MNVRAISPEELGHDQQQRATKPEMLGHSTLVLRDFTFSPRANMRKLMWSWQIPICNSCKLYCRLLVQICSDSKMDPEQILCSFWPGFPSGASHPLGAQRWAFAAATSLAPLVPKHQIPKGLR